MAGKCTGFAVRIDFLQPLVQLVAFDAELPGQISTGFLALLEQANGFDLEFAGVGLAGHESLLLGNCPLSGVSVKRGEVHSDPNYFPTPFIMLSVSREKI